MSDVTVTLPDGSELTVPEGSSVEDVAYEIGPGLGADTVAGVINGDLADRHDEVEDGDRLVIVTDQSDEYRQVLRHSAAHVFAQALQRLHPEAKLTIGPPTDDGFYYDVTNVDLDEDGLEEIEAEMEEIIEADYDIERVERSREDALATFEDNEYKREILTEEAAGEETVSFYVQDDWEDLCQGPHIESTGEIGAVKLLNVSSSYWRGDEDNDTLTRVHGTAFESEADLEEFIQMREEAEERDHRKIGSEMDLFSIPDHSPGCVHFHPPGMAIRRELEEYIRGKNDELGYEEVWTPELNKAELWKPTGHYENFTENGEMFNWEQDDTEYGLKPMNCANHAHIYDDTTHSYRDLPIRLSEFGTCYRNEQSGELSGLLRVRGFTQDDGHAFIRTDQIEGEIRDALRIVQTIYGDFGFDISYKLETRGEGAVGSEDVWNNATDALKAAMETESLDYDIEDGEAAFYGPKIGIDVHDAIGREWTVGTIQLDFNIPRELDLTYVGEDNDEHHPVMVHRALLGSFERFMGVLIEHFKGNFPTWLAPEQVRILPISEDQLGYAHRVKNELGDHRVEVDDHDWTIGRKIRAAHDDRVPYMLIVGGDEAEAGTVSVRDRFENERDDVATDDFAAHLETEIESRTIEPDFIGE
ncbi:threonine--tRNA ligase [Halosegnis rubeus]|jgi:threonyl-tRNA synthetase|uniref:Threonine--tRNA ligase n=1 Tax=Halosegnis rubeus TaxID=2212850 RepID=A0A5N5UF76_9EURY|nr:threonine--tRNA ligase [Halosegnis rubeus]KAB7515664.1 threonine--tRNA ligase [Halosegnis rubeus]KAB7517130.1 threonine--tRNA ligase [Halosegnis rubeus]KAB7519751.1 threonine--tRNA ligase [Halosegnis rubeus]